MSYKFHHSIDEMDALLADRDHRITQLDAEVEELAAARYQLQLTNGDLGLLCVELGVLVDTAKKIIDRIGTIEGNSADNFRRAQVWLKSFEAAKAVQAHAQNSMKEANPAANPM